MALPLPQLDDRTFAMLVREGLAVIPRRAPGWTDHNVHDPGITLLELISSLVEEDIYRLDRTPAESTRAYLRLVGIEPAPPAVAAAVVELGRSAGSGPAVVAAGQPVTGAGGAIAFELAAPVYVADARLVGVASAAGDRWLERGRAAFAAFGPAPAAGDALHLGFDAPLGAGGERVSLHVWTGDDAADAETRRRLVGEGGADWRLHYGVRTAWEYWSARGWAALPSVEDETRALSLTGFVRFDVPVDHAPGGAGPAAWTGRWVVRCRIVSGRYECRPMLARVAAHAGWARHAALVGGWEALGVSDGRAGQAFATAASPVVASSVDLRVVVDGEVDEPWRDVPHADRVGPHDRVALLEPERGRLTFGDGRTGRVPPAGARIACRYRVGGGSAGNVAAGTLVEAPGAGVSVGQPFAALGGAPAELLTDAKGRAIAWLAERRRAVTLDDYQVLALATPGVPVARAWALGDHHPDLPCVKASGCVTVVAVPRCPADRPEASAAFLAAVRCWLEPRRTLTDELHVVGPRYRAVAVEATIHADRGCDPVAIRAAALAALGDFFHPLHGGPDRAGWPVGRDAYRSEVLAALSAVGGVAWIDGFAMRGEGGARSCGNVEICPDQMAASGEHHIAVVTRRDRS